MSRQKLIELEETGNYVFHGSPKADITVLEPRQGTHIPDLSKRDEIILDGDPSVAATPYADFAIFRAIINSANIKLSHHSGFGHTKEKKKEFRVSSKQVLEEAKGKKGFVYVLDKRDFTPYNRSGKPFPESMEWRSTKTVTPLFVIEVDSADLPSKEVIEIA